MRRREQRREVNRSTVKYNVRLNGEPTSITLRKETVALWILLSDYDPVDTQEIVLNFIHNQCLPRWKGKYGKGLSEFVTLCMFRAVLDKNDFFEFRKIYRKL